MTQNRTVLVLGIGNVLLGDEGAGVRVIEELEKRYRFPEAVRLLDGGTSGMELLNDLAVCDHLIVCDCVRLGQPPGTVVRLDDEEVPAMFRNKLSPHQLGLSDVLATAQLTGEGPDRVTLFGIEPEEMETGMNLTATVAAQIGRVADLVVAELGRLGHTAEAA